MRQIVGGLGVSNTSLATGRVAVEANSKLNTGDQVALIRASGAVVTLPDDPFIGEEHLIVGDGFAGVLDGGSNVLFGGPISIDINTAQRVVFGENGAWIPEGCCASGSEWLIQPDYYFNPISGNDAAKGDTPETALKTFAEWTRRIGNYNFINIVMTLHVLGDMPPTDPLNFLVAADAPGSIRVISDGPAEILATGTFQNPITAQDPLTNQRWQLRGSQSWAPLLGKRVRVTSGPNAGLTSYPIVDLGGDDAFFSNFAFIAGFFDGVFVVPGTPVAGDPYQVERLWNITLGVISFLRGAFDVNVNPLINIFSIESLNLSPTSGGFTFVNSASGDTVLYGCTTTNVDIDAGSNGGGPGSWTLLNCSVGNLVGEGGAINLQAGCSIGGAINTFNNGVIQPDGDWIAEASVFFFIAHDGACIGGNFAVFDCQDGGIALDQGGVLQFQTGQFGPGICWGSGNNGTGLALASGAQALINDEFGNHTPTITGTAGDFTMGSALGLLLGQAFDVTAGPTGSYTAPITCSWANLDLPIGAGGFGGNALGVDVASSIVKGF